eukprot:CAMPEP_0204263152 /NCGR_PEP_ID=MMETSP0468-20130131/8152_1 /ASSEMBLY_ACC=CAM_ASM_000383 /TAXON_ID=2969 /ORGANISM="Oxyrrhis marina" /LENGTH=153 /DNA_ID=CAMNT_0051237897 /DNA_START=60 /DNA_END=521 /DNA_ORIENTATION=-
MSDSRTRSGMEREGQMSARTRSHSGRKSRDSGAAPRSGSHSARANADPRYPEIRSASARSSRRSAKSGVSTATTDHLLMYTTRSERPVLRDSIKNLFGGIRAQPCASVYSTTYEWNNLHQEQALHSRDLGHHLPTDFMKEFLRFKIRQKHIMR